MTDERQRMELESAKLQSEIGVDEWMDDGLFDAMIWDVSSGLTPKKWCDKVGLPVAGVLKYVDGNQERREKYEKAKVRYREVAIMNMMGQLVEIVTSDRMAIFTDNDDGVQVLKHRDQWPDAVREAVEDIDMYPDGRIKKVRFVRKGAALDQLAKGLGAYMEHKKVTHEVSGIERYLGELADERFGKEGLIEGEVISKPRREEEADDGIEDSASDEVI